VNLELTMTVSSFFPYADQPTQSARRSHCLAPSACRQKISTSLC